MANERSSFAQTLETGASTAQFIRGAVKAGSAISGVAKGAMAGPYGILASIFWTSRHDFAKLMAILTAVLMVPIVVIMMLPGLMFGGYDDAYSLFDLNNPILNSELAIIETANEIQEAVSEVLMEALEKKKAEIEAEFALKDADQMEIKNPYETDLAFSINQLIAMYCAGKSDDYASVSIEDLRKTLRDNMEHLYTYTVVEEIRDTVVTDPETGDESVIQETYLVYTILYNGESYFADHVFQLTDAEKTLADTYTNNIRYFLDDGMFQESSDWTGESIPSIGDVNFSNGVTEVIYYNQLDAKYANQSYGTDNIGRYGCGPTAMAIVVSSMTTTRIDPIQMAKWAYQNGYWCKGSGSYHALIPGAARNWGLPVSGCTASQPQWIKDALANGKLIVALMGKGHFTSSGHFIVLRGIKDGKILVADPSSYGRSEKLWDLDIFLKEAKHGASAGGPFWIIG